ncbi:MAG: SET domain-containing protein [Chitinophagaceae bacterium]
MPENFLVVKKSKLPNAGKGLFTKKFIAKGTKIIEYKGRISTWKEVEHHKGENMYIFYVKRTHVINAEPFKKALARYANDAKGLQKVKGLSNNAEYYIKGLQVFIKAIKDIPAGSEIFVDYGKEYWDTIKYNNKLDEKEKKS